MKLAGAEEMPHRNKWRNLEQMVQKQDGVKVRKPSTWLSKLSYLYAHFAQNNLSISHSLNKSAAETGRSGNHAPNQEDSKHD